MQTLAAWVFSSRKQWDIPGQAECDSPDSPLYVMLKGVAMCYRFFLFPGFDFLFISFRCRSMTYSSDLPLASIIICFHNEAWSTLLRTIHSVLNRTAENLVHEIILVNDLSTLEELKERLQNYVAKFPKLKLVQTSKREGLIRGRMMGAKHATGDVLVFLDSHCEVNKEWLPPLLERVKENPTTVVCPVIDIISSDTFEYQTSPLVRGGFNWGLHFSWEPVPKHLLVKPEDFVQPIR